ncbi:MAG: winged helix-turn-helix transcriptional regulator [Thermoplasmata archaeon]|nr:MAG: winged helix-turn-helix transcriptional regulator [Thermoplasmata archaeon]
MADKSLAKALKRKMGLDEEILETAPGKRGDYSLLMNGTRRRIFEHICNHPCNHLRALSRALDISPQTVSWHLKKLISGGLISEMPFGDKKLYLPLKDFINPAECRTMAVLNNDEVKNIYLYIAQHPESTQKEICHSMDLYQQKLSIALLSLEGAGLIVHDRKGKRKLYKDSGRIKALREDFDRKGEHYRRLLKIAFEKDGLNPSMLDSPSDTILFQLDVGAGDKPMIKVKINPIEALLGPHA